MNVDNILALHNSKIPPTKPQGFTLIEVLVSMLIFSVVVASLPSVFVAHLRYNQRAEIKTAALLAAQRVLDDYRVQDPSTLPTSGSQDFLNITINGYNFDATAYFCLESAYCLASTNRHIRVEISYDTNTVYGVETVFTRLR